MTTAYVQFCTRTGAPLQLQPWWLDAVCGPEGWSAALATDGSGAVRGILPWLPTRRFGLPVIQMPPLTTYAGPWLEYPANPGFKAASRPGFEKKMMTELIRQLPPRVLFRQNFRPEITNWLPFYWAGFRQTTRYTYIAAPIANPALRLANYKNTVRTDLEKACHLTTVADCTDDPAILYPLYVQTLRQKKRRPGIDAETFQRLHTALHTRGQARALVALDRQSGEPHAGLYLAFDQTQAALLFTATVAKRASSCALHGLLHEALVFCDAHGLSLDFEGSMDAGLEHLFRSFGGRLTPYFQVWRWGGKRFF